MRMEAILRGGGCLLIMPVAKERMPVMSCVTAKCASTTGYTGASSIGGSGQGHAWRRGRPLSVSCCHARLTSLQWWEKELRAECQR